MNILEAAAKLIRPFTDYLADFLRTDHTIGSDATGVPLLLPKEVPKINEADPKSQRVAEVIAKAKAESAKSIHAKMWAYRGVSVPINVFDSTVSRHRDGPDLFLIDNHYEGTLLGDCYANTAALAEDLQRFLRSEPILARRPPLIHRTKQAVRRHKLLSATGALVILATLLADTISRGLYLIVLTARTQPALPKRSCESSARLRWNRTIKFFYRKFGGSLTGFTSKQETASV